MGTEIWRTAVYDDVVYEGYEVSNFGRVRSLNYNRTNKIRELKSYTNKFGYLRTYLRKDNVTKYIFVHRLVANVFIPNPLNLSQVNHKDENKTNNNVENLEWCTCTYNINYGSRNEKSAKTNTNGKKSKKVLQFSLTGEFIREWPSTMECGRNGFIQGNVAACCRGQYKKHKGYIWRYKE